MRSALGQDIAQADFESFNHIQLRNALKQTTRDVLIEILVEEQPQHEIQGLEV
jgi:hypothetical protein